VAMPAHGGGSSTSRGAHGAAAEDASTGGGWRDDAARAQKERRDNGAPRLPRMPRKGEEAPAKPVRPLEVSPTSWVAQQQARKKGVGDDHTEDVEVVRAMKAILNKLTIEKFGPLYQQLIGCGIKRAEHVEILMREVFEKATTQHHFIGMYAELCAQLHRWFVENQVCGDDGKNFKRILLNRCQLSFEETLRPQEPTEDLDPEKREEAEQLHKTRMLGNLRLVGALLEKGMLASRVLVAVIDELLATPTAASLECLSVFLTAVGPAFDRPDWSYHAHLLATFKKVKELCRSRDVPSRIRFLLQDVLDLRASSWENKKKAVRTQEGPTTLDAVHRQAEEELSEKLTPLARPNSSSTCGSPYSVSSATASAVRWSPLAQAVSPPAQASVSSPSIRHAAPPRAEPFDKSDFREEVLQVLKELRGSLDVKVALERVTARALPAEFQASELADLVSRVAEEGRAPARRAGFRLVAQLFLSGSWQRRSLCQGLNQFFNDQYSELLLDIPALGEIVKEDLAPELTGLVTAGLLEAEGCDRWLAAASGHV